MNNNNRGNNNNRRRGRGNNNNRQNGGAQLNRVDSRARGNAPQMLEKYRKLAHDAHLNGDRVQEEYYLQFADHYFRVIADTRLRQEEQRGRQGERGEGGSEEGAEENEFSSSENEYQPYERQQYDRQPQDRQQTERQERQQQDRQERQPRERDDRNWREDRPQRDDRGNRSQRNNQYDRQGAENEPVREQAEVSGDQPAYEPAENPFVRSDRPARGLKPRRDDRAPRAPRENRDEPAGLDASILPPSFGAARSEEPAVVAEDEAPAPKRRGRPAKAKVEVE